MNDVTDSPASAQAESMFLEHVRRAVRRRSLRAAISPARTMNVTLQGAFMLSWGGATAMSAVSHLQGPTLGAAVAVSMSVAAAGIAKLATNYQAAVAWSQNPDLQYLKGLLHTIARTELDHLPWPYLIQAHQLACPEAARRQLESPLRAGWATPWHTSPISREEAAAATSLDGLIDPTELQAMFETVAEIDERNVIPARRCCAWCRAAPLPVSVGELRRAVGSDSGRYAPAGRQRM